MKKLIFLLFILFASQPILFAQHIGQAEIRFDNLLEHDVIVTVSPIGAIFSGRYTGEGHQYKYSFAPSFRQTSRNFDFLIGGTKIVEPEEFILVDFDDGAYSFYGEPEDNERVLGCVSYGLWKLEVSYVPHEEEIPEVLEYCYIDYRDFEYSYTSPFYNDLYFKIYLDESEYKLDAHFGGNGSWFNIYDERIENKTVNIWHQVGRTITVGGLPVEDPIHSGSPNKGNFNTDNSTYTVGSINYTFKDYPLKADDYGSIPHTNPSDVSLNFNIDNNGMKVLSGETMNFNDVNFIIGAGKTFEVESSAILNFNGSSTFKTSHISLTNFTIGNTSVINMNEESKLDLSYTNFLSSGTWQGIKCDNTLTDKIINCTFNNTPTCLDIDIDNVCFSGFKREIKGNTFTNGNVELTNAFSVLIQSNSFSSSSSSMTLLAVNNDYLPSEVGTPVDPCSLAGMDLKIVYNTFSGGLIQTYLDCDASSLTPFYIAANTYSGTTAGNGIMLWARKISGDFKNNVSSGDYGMAVKTIGSSLKMYNNPSIVSEDFTNVDITAGSSVRMAPVITGGEYYWYGGLNSFTSNRYNVVLSNSSNEMFSDYGKNCFTMDNENYDHINGYFINCSGTDYYSRDNYWNIVAPLYDITCGSSPGTLIYDPDMKECPPIIVPIDFDVIDKGDGIYDTLFITEEEEEFAMGGGTATYDDAELYIDALGDRNEKDYSSAIVSLKTIIDSIGSSKYLYSALDELYLNTVLQDTSGIRSNTLSMFGSLKSYLEAKVEHYSANDGFIERAYNYYLMCLVRTGDYEDAIEGYENIIDNHPDADTRLSATWDRAAVILLLDSGGNGGGQPYKLETDTDREEEGKKFYDREPVHRSARDIFLLKKAEVQNSSRNVEKRENRALEHRIVKFNPSSREELEAKKMGDIYAMMNIDMSKLNEQNASTTTDDYRLEQSYPNPFNPKTVITFSIPAASLVKLNVYDITGRLIQVLTNEMREAGTHNITFDGSRLSSGVYFYKMEAGSFIETKRMVLVK